MSHSAERKEKDCLNCGAVVQGRFCQVCGQENVVPHESFWSMLHHFFADITHFDGKFFSSLAILIRKPGFLSSQYIQGKRNRYLNPVRMYVFTSALFFLVFFSVFNTNNLVFDYQKGQKGIPVTTGALLRKGYENAQTKEDSMAIERALAALADTSSKDKTDSAAGGKGVRISTTFQPFDDRYTSLAEYDSIQGSLPAEKKDGFWRRLANRKSLELGDHYKSNEKEFWVELLEKFMHTFPYMLFVSLPLYALFLKLLFFRKKQFFYADHGIFLIHLYIFTFILLLLLIGLTKLKEASGFEWLGIIITALLVYGFYYTLRAMKSFYKQGWAKTIIKFVLFNILCVLALSLLFSVFFGLSIFRL